MVSLAASVPCGSYKPYVAAEVEGRSEEAAEALLREYLGGANDRRQRMDLTTPLWRNSEGAVSLYLPGIQAGTLLQHLLANGLCGAKNAAWCKQAACQADAHGSCQQVRHTCHCRPDTGALIHVQHARVGCSTMHCSQLSPCICCAELLFGEAVVFTMSSSML